MVPFHLGGHKPVAVKPAAFGLKLRLQVAGMGALAILLGRLRPAYGVLSEGVVAFGVILLLFAVIPTRWIEKAATWMLLAILVASAQLAHGQSDGLQYCLAPNDQITIRAPRAPKLDGKTFQIQGDGFVRLPLIGRILAAGLTTDALEKQVVKRLKGGPKVSISVMAVSGGPSR